MKRLRKINDNKELKVGMLLLTVDDGGESLDYIDCIDDGIIYTVDHAGIATVGETLCDYVQSYNVVYEVL